MNQPKYKKLPSDALTVIFRDDSPTIHCGDSPSYRTVTVKLTDEQREALSLRFLFSQGNNHFWEDISRAIIEPAVAAGEETCQK